MPEPELNELGDIVATITFDPVTLLPKDIHLDFPKGFRSEWGPTINVHQLVGFMHRD